MHLLNHFVYLHPIGLFKRRVIVQSVLTLKRRVAS